MRSSELVWVQRSHPDAVHRFVAAARPRREEIDRG